MFDSYFFFPENSFFHLWSRELIFFKIMETKFLGGGGGRGGDGIFLTIESSQLIRVERAREVASERMRGKSTTGKGE